MAQTEPAGGLLATLSSELASVVERSERAVVAVDARRQRAASGILWPLGDGVVVTADHVIERDEDIAVILADGQRVAATLAGRDPGSDVAVLRLVAGAAAPAPAELAPADSVKVGHLVLALGRPAGLPMASLGIVSGLGGSWRTERGGVLEGYVRADVTLYPGFSGGPLIDTRGRVIGMNSWHLARGQEVSIPAAALHGIVQALLAQGRIRRAYLGVVTQPVQIPAGLRQAVSPGQGTGLMIVGVEPGSPAEQAGLLLGDVLIGVAGRPVADAEDLQGALGPATVGQPVTVVVIRGGQRTELTATPSERV